MHSIKTKDDHFRLFLSGVAQVQSPMLCDIIVQQKLP